MVAANKPAAGASAVAANAAAEAKKVRHAWEVHGRCMLSQSPPQALTQTIVLPHCARAVQEGRREHQQPSGSGDEVGQVPAGLQDRPEDSALRQGSVAIEGFVNQRTRALVAWRPWKAQSMDMHDADPPFVSIRPQLSW